MYAVIAVVCVDNLFDLQRSLVVETRAGNVLQDLNIEFIVFHIPVCIHSLQIFGKDFY